MRGQGFLRRAIWLGVLAIGSVAAWADNSSLTVNERRAVDLMGGSHRVKAVPARPIDTSSPALIISIFLPYSLETGAFTPAAADKLLPLYRVISASELQAYQFEVICCKVLPIALDVMQRSQWMNQLQLWFNRLTSSHHDNVTFRLLEISSSVLPVSPHGSDTHVARLDVYRVK